MIDVAIVGAGPAGSNCAYTLAKKGLQATLFDHSHPREKPCGGMMGMAAVEAFPISEKLPIERSEINSMQVISPSRKWTIDMSKNKMLGFSRMRFDKYLLDKALIEGAELKTEKVMSLEKNENSWKIVTQKQSYEAKIIVGADGVHSLVRKSTVGSFDKTNLGACYGHLFKGTDEKSVIIKFLPKIQGYIWLIPRGDNTNIGGGTTKINYFQELKNEVEKFIQEDFSTLEKTLTWAALIPNVKNKKAFLSPVAGPNWVTIGDAAGHVSPISGSGIMYALIDGELAAESIVERHVEKFNKRWVDFYGKELFFDARMRGLIYHRPILDFYCMFAKFHSAFSFH